MRFFIYLIWILIAIVLITVALANPTTATVNLTPEWLPVIGGFSLTFPMFVHIYIALFAGMALGVFVEYLREGRYRRAARRAKRELKKSEKKLAKTQSDNGQNDDDVLALVDA